jgi:Zn-dependent protease with chaperone function
MTGMTPRSQPTLLAALPQPSTAYKRRVWLAVAGLLAFIALYFVLAGWFLYTAYRMTIGADSIAVEGGFIAFCALFLAVMMLKPLFFVKHGGTDGSIEITEEQQPRLFAFLHALADTAEAPRPHRVFLAANVNAGVFYDLSALNLIIPSKKNLEIGLGLVNALTLGEMRAVLAHEFGHFSQSSMAVIRWSYLAQQIAANLIARRDRLDDFLVRLSNLDIRLAWIGWMLSLIVWSIRSLVDTAFGIVALLQRALSREMEFQADLVSVSLTGSDALIHALHRLQAADDSWDRTMGLVADLHGSGKIPRDVFTLHTRIMQRMAEILSDPGYGQVPPVPADGAEEHRLFKAELAQPPRMWLTHPLNHDREDNAKRDYVRAPIDDRSAWTLFDDATSVREQMTATMMGLDAKEPVPIDESLEALDAQFSREYFATEYRGVYLGRSVVRGAAKPQSLVEPVADWRRHLDQLYPEALVKDVARLRALEKELGMLRAIHVGALTAAEGGIRHRGRVIKPRELPEAIERVERDEAGVEKRLAANDRLCRSVHLAAARELGGGWAEYLDGLLATLHYADHATSNIRDLHGVLAHTVHVSTVTRRISSAGRKRVLTAAKELYGVLADIYGGSAKVSLDIPLAQRLGNTSWAEIIGKFELGAPDEENLGDWLGVIDGWVEQAAGACGALRTEALEQLLVTEKAIASHARAGTSPEPAPAPSRVPTAYGTLLVGQERERKDTLNWWERFQIADGKVAARARVAVAATIVAAVLGFGDSVGSSTISVYNGLAVPVIVTVGENEYPLTPGGSYTEQFATVGVHPIVARTRQGKLIDSLDARITGSFGSFVYNVAGAAPLIEWVQTYGNAEGEPDSSLGAPRWTRTSAGRVLREPPDSVKTKDGGAIVRVLSGAAELAPGGQLSFVEDSIEQLRMVEAHARWDATSSEYILSWLSLAEEISPTFTKTLAIRLRETPDDVLLLRAEQDAATGAAKDSVCARHRARAEAAPDSANYFYLAVRCVEDGAAKAQAYVEAHAHWPTNPWLAYAAGYQHVEAGQWAEAVPALELARRRLPPLAKNVAMDLARIHRLLGSDSGQVMGALVKSSEQLGYLIDLETGKGLEKTPGSAYKAMMQGELEKAIQIAHDDSLVEANVLRLAAASDGASAEIQARALALASEAGLDNDTRWASIGLAMRTGRDHKPYLPTDEQVPVEYLLQVMRFAERARAATDLPAAEAELVGLPPVLRGHAYSMATVILGSRAPGQWRMAAKRLLFASERPWFN